MTKYILITAIVVGLVLGAITNGHVFEMQPEDWEPGEPELIDDLRFSVIYNDATEIGIEIHDPNLTCGTDMCYARLSQLLLEITRHYHPRMVWVDNVPLADNPLDVDLARELVECNGGPCTASDESEESLPLSSSGGRGCFISASIP